MAVSWGVSEVKAWLTAIGLEACTEKFEGKIFI